MLAKTIGTAVVASAFSSAATYALLDNRLTPIETRMAHTPPLMVLDSAKMAAQLTDLMPTPKFDPALEKLGRALDKLRDEGYLILYKDAVASPSIPQALDVNALLEEQEASEAPKKAAGEDANRR